MNAPSHDFFERLARVVKKTIAHEMRGCAITLSRDDVRPAGPHDSDAEQAILSALLCGHSTLEALEPLDPKHFYSHFNQRLFAVFSESPERDLQLVADALGMLGPVIEELTMIRDATPFVVATTLREHVDAIQDRWRERELIRVMQRIDAELRTGTITHDGARGWLREHFVATQRRA